MSFGYIPKFYSAKRHETFRSHLFHGHLVVDLALLGLELDQEMPSLPNMVLFGVV